MKSKDKNRLRPLWVIISISCLVLFLYFWSQLGVRITIKHEGWSKSGFGNSEWVAKFSIQNNKNEPIFIDWTTPGFGSPYDNHFGIAVLDNISHMRIPGYEKAVDYFHPKLENSETQIIEVKQESLESKDSIKFEIYDSNRKYPPDRIVKLLTWIENKTNGNFIHRLLVIADLKTVKLKPLPEEIKN